MTGTRDLFDYDAELHRYHERLRTALDVGAADRVLDIGCGTGQMTREAARAAVSGHALGVDISARMLAQARRLSKEEGLRNLAFLHADAQVHRFPLQRFDLGISRFGTMFFTDPVAAFTNIGRTLRPRARGWAGVAAGDGGEFGAADGPGPDQWGGERTGSCGGC